MGMLNALQTFTPPARVGRKSSDALKKTLKMAD
jgi:hypothetical protein